MKSVYVAPTVEYRGGVVRETNKVKFEILETHFFKPAGFGDIGFYL